jgi:hypothetical protein
MVDRVNVLHTVQHDLANLLKTFVTSHRRDCVALHKDVALRKELDRLFVGRQAVSNFLGVCSGPIPPRAPLT